jgi:T5SS/PEP-CTERM-associated repeat protein
MKNLPLQRFALIPLAVLGFLGTDLTSRAEKIWTNSASGLWTDGTNWTGHTPPDITSFIRITNDNTKTITIDATAASTNLTVQKLTLSAPPGATNTLLLSNTGTNNPLIFQTGLELTDGAAIRITNSALVTQLTNDHVNIDGSLTLDSGFIDFGDVTVTSRVGRATSGVLILNSGTISAGTMTVGGLTNSTGTVYQNGGTLTVGGLLSVGRNLSTTGAFFLSGGQLDVPNDDTRVGDEGVGQMVVTNSTASLTNLQVGRDGAGTMTIQSNGIVQVLTDVAIGRFTGSTGTLAVAEGQLLNDGQKIYVGRGGNAQLNISAGTIQADSALVNADTTNSIGGTGTMTMTGGSLLLASNLLVGSVGFSSGQAFVSGGTISVTNSGGSGVLAVPNGTLTLNGASVIADTIVLTNASGQLTFSGGILSTKGSTVANGAAFVVGDGMSPATFHLNGGTHTFANGLVISSNATLDGCGTVIGNIINHGTIATNCGGGVIPPAITQQPQAETIAQGGRVTFTVAASGTQPLYYQWELNGTNIAGATSTAYTKTNVQPSDTGNYVVVVTNMAGSITSPPAMLQVVTGITIGSVNRSGTTNTITVPSVIGWSYTLQYKNTLTDPTWTDIPPTASGTGSLLLLQDATATGPSRFYRVRAQ